MAWLLRPLNRSVLRVQVCGAEQKTVAAASFAPMPRDDLHRALRLPLPAPVRGMPPVRSAFCSTLCAFSCVRLL